jgi:hypothetical protein
MQLCLVGLLFVGLDRGSFGVVVNASIALVVTHLPAVLERDYAIPMDPALTLWVTSAVFLHALGVVGLPVAGTGGSFYTSVPWWDHLTHTLSSSVVGATGYATIRALDVHAETVRFPGRFVAVFLLLFVLAFGVFWEVIEFALAGAAAMLGHDAVLTQYGLEDTMLDLFFDAVGGVLVAVWGTAYLSDVVGALAARLDRTRA